MPHTQARNITNCVLMVLVALPWVFSVCWMATCAQKTQPADDSSPCGYAVFHPLRSLNLLFLAAISILFWVISLLQRSTWLIDPYWTFIPLMIAHFYQFHPLATSDELRGHVALGLIYFWSARLTHSYFRREEWQFGAREDWRFADFSDRFPSHWWWMSLFVCYLSQQAFLVGVTLPLFAVFTSAEPWNHWDTLAAVLCVVAVVGAYFADTQLRDFMVANEERRKQGLETVPLLNSGLFYHSRHPNYFFEQLFWWSLWIFAWNLGHAWMAAGAFVNSVCLAIVSVMVEQRMLRKKERVAILTEYFATTSAVVPWFKFKSKTA